MSDPVVCHSAGVPPTQLNRYGSPGSIDLSAVLEPLDFLLPQRETPVPEPELDVAADLGGLAFDTQLKELETDPELTAEAGPPDPGDRDPGYRDPEEMVLRDKEMFEEEEFSLD